MMNLDLIVATANEPAVHKLIKEKSIAFIPSAGARYSPELLVLELMREVFFSTQYGQPGHLTKEINPDDPLTNYLKEEKIVLHALRGRRKNNKSKSQTFFAPAYPALAKHGWFSKNRERVILNFLLSGPIVQALWSKGETNQAGKEEQEKIIKQVIGALKGFNSNLEEGVTNKEILAVVLGKENLKMDIDLSFKKLEEKTNLGDWAPFNNLTDKIAIRITEDLKSICTLEKVIPRMQWLQILMTFLRFSLPIWLLSQMQVIKLLHSWTIDSMDYQVVPDQKTINNSITNRYKNLLVPTLTPTRELFEHIEDFMKCRVELNAILYFIDFFNEEKIKNKKLKLEGGSSEELGIEDFLIIARDTAEKIKASSLFKEIAPEKDIKTFLIRLGERFAAWRNPLLKGQGKNIDEFFRVLYKAEEGDEAGGFLIAPQGRGSKRGFRVFPGQLLLKTMTYLAASNKQNKKMAGGAGKLILLDVEKHFEAYGINFSFAADARPLLMKELQALGLLIGSPDAGSSVSVFNPYKIKSN